MKPSWLSFEFSAHLSSSRRLWRESWGRHPVARARIAALILVAAQALGCAGQQGSPSQPASQSPPPTPTPLVGAPLQAGPPPSSETCREELIGDLAAAKRIRTDLRVPGIAPTDAAIAAAANDPTADTSTAGIPLTHSELGALAASGLAMDGGNPLSEWVQVGEPGRFGGIWISPPGSGRYVVSILASDPDALGLAQCVGKGVDIRFVVADTTVADLKALVDQSAMTSIRCVRAGSRSRAPGLACKAQSWSSSSASLALRTRSGPRLSPAMDRRSSSRRRRQRSLFEGMPRGSATA